MSDLTVDQKQTLLTNALVVINDSASTSDQKISAIIDILTSYSLI